MNAEVAISSLRQVAPFPGLLREPAPTLRDVFVGKVAETHAAGEALIFEGDVAGQVFEVVTGVLRAFRILPDGRRAIMGFLYAGDVIGVSHYDRYLVTAEAITEVKVRRMPRSRFFAEVNDSQTLRPLLFALLCEGMTAAQDQMLLLCRKNAEERVVSFLLSVHEKSAVGAMIELPMGRLDMADYLGLTIETVSRVMTSLARRELISTVGRHAVNLRKLSALRRISGDDEGADGDFERAATRRAVWPQ
jgi:CRP/FNR family transcriptional regulator